MAKKGRIRLETEELATREQAESVFAEYARLTVELEMVEAELADEITTLNDRYEGTLEKLKEQRKAKSKLLNTWAKANPEEFVDGRKSIEFIYGRIGFRTTTPKVAAVKGKTLDQVLEELVVVDLAKWIRKEPELNKEAILDDWRNGRVTTEALEEFGLRVTQRETFFVEPKLDAKGKEERAS